MTAKEKYINDALILLSQSFNLPLHLADRLNQFINLLEVPAFHYLEYPGPAEEGYLWYVVRGVSRSVAYDKNTQNYYTLFLWKKGDVIFQADSFLFGGMRTESLQTLDDSVLLQLPTSHLKRLLDEWPSLHPLLTRLVAQYELRLVRYSYWLRSAAIHRVQLLLLHYPGIAERVPHYILADYLNLNRNTFRKLLKKLRS
ncbi:MULTISPECIES: Crp/Fnr family transcriptional regulator [Olivibacter]|uniref:Crp/Fnr family transcriptional regulator n=1 Tax=Olivibacter jilunii TaxID=985016 RepID=A0ABW6B477_9SPHI|nr:Crp/Fnr family transcriptional regulator [Pseudosphingobacterium sp.]